MPPVFFGRPTTLNGKSLKTPLRRHGNPGKPGKMRVYLYGSHDTMVNGYCGYDYTLWLAPLRDGEPLGGK